MTDKAKGIVEAIKQAFDVFTAMELPIEEQKCEITRDAAMTLIAELEQVTRERDAAIKGLHGDCWECAHRGNWEVCTDCVHFSPLDDYGKKDNWQWRGVEVTNDAQKGSDAKS